MQRRTGGRRFTLVFALVPGALHIGLFALGGLGRFTVPSVFAGVPLGMWLLLGGPMLWALPAASVRPIRRRWLMVIAAIGVIVVVILIVGTALGRPVLHITNTGSYAISLDSGVILLEGDLDPDQAVSILTDLKKASVEEIAALHVDAR